MGFLDRVFGTGEESPRRAPRIPQNPHARPAPAASYRDADGRYAPPPGPGETPGRSSGDDDRGAIDRYRYLLRTAPPETIEQVHAEAFGRLTEPQRQQVLAEMSSTLSPAERPLDGDPRALARAATRAEYLQPGYMERTFANRSFAGRAGAPGVGSMLGASMLGTIGGYVIGSALVGSLMGPGFGDPGAGGESDAGSADPGADAAGDPGGGFGDIGGGFDGFDF